MSEGQILLVDDDESVLITMQAVLELQGYAVTATSLGVDALRLLNERRFDLVLTDLRLDDIDGMSILSEVQRSSPETVAIMLTGYASVESAIKALREGAYAYLIKPCNVEELKATIARGMERRQLTIDIRERVVQLEEANATIQSLNSSLQRRVDEATAQLTQQMEELARAKNEIATLYDEASRHVTQLKELDRLKSQFLSMASHELKTPLTSISGFLQLGLRRAKRRLERGYPTREEWEPEIGADVEQLETLERQTRRLARLVDELLDVSRIQTGRVEFHFGPVDVLALVRDVATQAQATTAKHQIVVTTQEGGQPIVADRDHLEQVVNNLLANAIKYSPAGGRITVSIEQSSDRVLLQVQDQGMGIPIEERNAIFDLFYRSPDQRARQAGGMGLGLYISSEIVRRHGGTIWVESQPGRGSTFFVELPTTGPGPGTDR